MSWGAGFCFWQTYRSDDLSENVLRHLIPHDLRTDVEGNLDFDEMLPNYRNLVVSIRMALHSINEDQFEQAIAQAQFITKCFERGVGTSPNYELALGWQRVACDLGDLEATIRISDTLRICVEDTSGRYTELTKSEMLAFAVTSIKHTLNKWRSDIEAQPEKLTRVEINNVATLTDLLHGVQLLTEARGEEGLANTALDELNTFLRFLANLGCVEKIDIPLRKKIEGLLAPLTRSGPSIVVCQEKLVKAKEFDPRPYLVLNKPIPLAEAPPTEMMRSALLSRYPWAIGAVEIIVREIQLREQFGSRAFLLPPLLLVGPAGCGKTSLAVHLGKLVGVPTTVYAVGGSSDNRAIQGTARGWSSGQSSLIVQTIARKKIGNPIFILDELDKASARSHNGNVWDTLHLLTERATSSRFFDDYLYTDCDLSHVSYIATANSLSRIPTSLLSRFRIVLVPKPSRSDAYAIEIGVRESFAGTLGIDPRFLPALDSEEFHRFGDLVGQSLRTAQRFYTDTLSQKIEVGAERSRCH